MPIPENPRSTAIRRRAVLARLALLALFPALAVAQSTGGPYTLRKQVIAAGGVAAAGGAYRLVGTVSEPGAAAAASGGAYRLSGGFHAPSARPDRLLCDGFEDTPCP